MLKMGGKEEGGMDHEYKIRKRSRQKVSLLTDHRGCTEHKKNMRKEKDLILRRKILQEINFSAMIMSPSRSLRPSLNTTIRKNSSQ